jgi:PAS domain S-box-containing protein
MSRLVSSALTSLFVVWLCAAQRSATDSLRRTNESLRAEIAERKRTEALLEGQKRVLETMAAGAPLSDSLAALMRLIEAQAPGMLGSILLLDERAARLWHAAAPSLPPEYMAAIDGLRIGPQAGSCGTAAYRKEPVFVEDIATDPRWEEYRAVALPHGLRACWSTPIFDSQRQVLGTLAMYYRQLGLPQPEHLRLIEMATHIAAIAVCGHRVQAVLRDSEARLKEAQRLAKIGYLERDLVTDRITWSEETSRIFGQPKELASPAKLQEIIHPDDLPLQREALRDVLERGRKYDVEYRIVLPNGQIRFVHAWDELERDASGRVIRIFGTVQDITERKQTELLLHARAQEIRAIVENSPDLIVRFDRLLRRTFVNTAFIKAMGLPNEELLGREIASAAKDGAVKATAEEIATLEGSLQRAFDTRQPLDFEHTWPQATGRRNFTTHLEPEFDACGALTSILAISRDITERMESDAALRRSEARKTAILDSALDCIVTIDHKACITEFNPAAERTFGYRRDEVVGKRLADVIIPPSLREEHRRGFARFLATGEARVLGRRMEMTAVRAGGGEFPVELAITRIPLEGPPSFTGYLRDITEPKRAEGELRDSHEQLRALTGRLETLREAERIRISREIHDELGQKLTVLKMDLFWMEQHLGEMEGLPVANAILDRVVGTTELVDGIIATVQKIAAELRPGVLDKLGLGTALQYEGRRFEDRAGIPCEVRIPETELALSAEVSTALFRIFQESLTNVTRHAHATKVETELKAEPGFIVLSLRDNGKGITEADIAHPQSLGLLGIRERAALLGGEVVLQAHPGQGTNVTVRIPMTGVAPTTGKPI